MTDLKPLSGSVSLDDLLKANKEQFDRIFTTQMEGGSARPEQPRTGPSGPKDATAELNAQFGKAWSSEVVEHKKAIRSAVNAQVKAMRDALTQETALRAAQEKFFALKLNQVAADAQKVHYQRLLREAEEKFEDQKKELHKMRLLNT